MKLYSLIILLFFLLSAGLPGQSIEDCLDCHDDPEFTMEKNGKEISLHVATEAFQKSAHRENTCIDCHTGFDPEEDPHKEVITPVDCSTCHEESVHAFSASAHRRELNCVTCHTEIHQPVNSARLAAVCQDCHDDAIAAIKESIHSTAEDGPGCFDCHSPHRAEAASSANCLSCHGDQEFAEKNHAESALTFVQSYSESIHAEDLECSDCHGGHDILSVDAENSPVNHRNIVATCNECHDDVTEEFMASEHGKALTAGFENAPNCVDCHGEHQIYASDDSRSNMSRQREIDVCLSCHLDSPDVIERTTHDPGFIAGYENSVHGRLYLEGNEKSAICSDCHGAHQNMKASDHASPVNKFNIAQTCGSCHDSIEVAFNESIHGEALAMGVEDSPTCTDCHGEHRIIEHEVASSPVAPQNVAEQVCGPCHNSVKLTEKYGISSDRFAAYNDSYHGLAVRFGDVEAANCASCHGVHDILPSSDERSMIHQTRLAETCGQCHPGANENFTIGKVHISTESGEKDIIYWIANIYLVLIIATVGSMSVHNILDWVSKTREKYQERFSPVPVAKPLQGVKPHLRMTVGERVQHIALASSFIALVITGFMLKFPEAWWVISIRQMGGEGIFELRGLLHRIAAVVMTAVTFYHMYYVLWTERGRQFFKDMLPRIQDARDMIIAMKHNLGFSKAKPRFDRFNYVEKIEYWALIWGTIIMGVTGYALWFENQSMAWFSKLFVDVCEAIHYFEAWLAFLAIVVWHLYYVIFNPDVYPMNFTWLTGKVSAEEMTHEHPLEWERIQEKEKEPEQADTEKSDSTESPEKEPPN